MSSTTALPGNAPLTGALPPVYTSGVATGVNGSLLVSNGTGITWSTANTNLTSVRDLQSRNLTLTGPDADIEINGVRLSDTLRSIQNRLNILVVNPELEAKWDQLAAKRREYEELEAELTKIEKNLQILESDF